MPPALSGRPVRILLVEDNSGDVRLTSEIMREREGRFDVTVVGDGAEALALLRREGDHAAAPRPDLILLDLRLPKMDGFEFLARVKADELHRRIPVVVLTSSGAETDVSRAYELGAAAYVAKPLDLMDFIDAVMALVRFWVDTATLPSE